MRQGKALERLVASLEKALSDSKNVTVESPKRLPDRTTGRLREHDVVLTVTEGHHTFLIGIECRDRSRPITVDQVEGFAAKCQDTGIGQGIIVSPSGFYNSARTKADHLGTRCLDLEEAESFDWLLAQGVFILTEQLVSNDWTFFPDQEGVVENDDFEIVDRDGNIVTMAVLTANAQKQLSKLLPEFPEPVEQGEISVRFPGSNLLLRSQSTLDTVPVKLAVVKIRYSIKKEFIPFRLVQYKEKQSEEIITDAAYVDLTIGENSARLLMVYKEDAGGKIVLVPQGKSNA